jgi:hypothetical protein
MARELLFQRTWITPIVLLKPGIAPPMSRRANSEIQNQYPFAPKNSPKNILSKIQKINLRPPKQSV